MASEKSPFQPTAPMLCWNGCNWRSTTGDGYLEQLYFTKGLKRTNRAIFVKFQYLFRY